MPHELVVSTIMVVAGIFGGVVNYLSDELNPRHWVGLIRSICVALAAAILVPLFLHTISSDLIEDTSRNADGYFVLAGFCLAAALCSQRFISSITSKLLDEIKVKTEAVEQQIDTVKLSVQPIIERAEDPDSSTTSVDDIEIERIRKKLGDLDTRILTAMDESRYTIRSPGGIAEQLKMASNSREAIRDSLIKMKELGLVSQVDQINPRSPRPRWYLSVAGRTVARSDDRSDTDHRP